MKKLFTLILAAGTYLCSAQQTLYDVTAGNGNGIRFWQADNYRIHMGSAPEYWFGPVQDYSIKMNMSDGTPSRGWTWGVAGATPIAALNTLGNMQIAGGFKAASLSVGATLNSRLIALYDSPSDWYGLGIQSYQMRLQVGTPNARFSFLSGDNNEVMTVQGNGNVGIGTTSPASMLHLNSTVDARKTFRIYWNNDITKYLSIWQGTGGAVLDPIGTGQLWFGYDQATNVIMGITSAGSISGNVGIGTTSPSSKLVIDGVDNYSEGITLQNSSSYRSFITGFQDGNNPTTGSAIQFKVANNNSGGNVAVMTLKGSGNVGIGTSTPGFRFHIRGINANSEQMTLGAVTTGNFALTSADGGAYGLFAGVSNTGRAWLQAGRYDTNTSYDLTLQASGGNVGIGTTFPNQKLTVNGTIYGKEVKVDLSVPGPDYVFEKDYQLLSLNQVKSYIDQNRHLPEVPSAAEMEKNGINVSEMNMLLLKKIEELTLYMIEQNKRIDCQQLEIKELKTLLHK